MGCYFIIPGRQHVITNVGNSTEMAVTTELPPITTMYHGYYKVKGNAYMFYWYPRIKNSICFPDSRRVTSQFERTPKMPLTPARSNVLHIRSINAYAVPTSPPFGPRLAYISKIFAFFLSGHHVNCQLNETLQFQNFQEVTFVGIVTG